MLLARQPSNTHGAVAVMHVNVVCRGPGNYFPDACNQVQPLARAAALSKPMHRAACSALLLAFGSGGPYRSVGGGDSSPSKNALCVFGGGGGGAVAARVCVA